MSRDYAHSYMRSIRKEYDAHHPHQEQQPALVRYRAMLFGRFALGHATEAEILLLPRLYFRGNDEIRALMEKYIRRNTSSDENARISGWLCFPDDPDAAEMVRRSILREISRKDSAKLQQRWDEAHSANKVDGCCIEEYITDEEKEALAAEYDIDVALISNEPLPEKHVWYVGGACSNWYDFAPDGSYRPHQRAANYGTCSDSGRIDGVFPTATYWKSSRQDVGMWECPAMDSSNQVLDEFAALLRRRRSRAFQQEVVKFAKGFATAVVVGIVAHLLYKRQKR